jgi:basic amino acid/polyamine antiporter, APA family
VVLWRYLFGVQRIYFVAPAGAASAIFLMFGLPTDNWTRLLVWLIVGLAIYFLYAKAHSKVGAGADS